MKPHTKWYESIALAGPGGMTKSPKLIFSIGSCWILIPEFAGTERRRKSRKNLLMPPLLMRMKSSFNQCSNELCAIMICFYVNQLFFLIHNQIIDFCCYTNEMQSTYNFFSHFRSKKCTTTLDSSNVPKHSVEI